MEVATMQEFLKLRPVARAYVAIVVLLGTATLLRSAHTLYSEPIGRQWFILAALTLLTGSFTVKVPSINASLSVSETFVFASVLIFGPSAGAITVLLECLIIQFWMKSDGRRLHRVLFNIAAPAIAIWVSGSAFFLISGLETYSDKPTPLDGLFLPLVVFTALYFLLNSWLVALALGFETRKSPLEIWWKNFTWLSVNYFSGASVAALLVTYTHRFDLGTLAIIVPLLVVSYLTFKTAMGRVEDASVHLTELNRLYLSTIETLAMAIDAKDQVTHGHIRRVQTYATGLARQIGIRDERMIKAIEAAALLHDMGKLAVPEYILNKPGKLTAAEFEKMKLHASVGADILTAIDFPYPVVPIVRHHHESWDGSGYPAGLRGTDIPIGARILSVVDCFDALTSDRPYRPRLSDDEALQILSQRRGNMYDPLVVDTFIRVHQAIAPEPVKSGPSPRALDEIASARKAVATNATSPSFAEIAASADEARTLLEMTRDLNNASNLSDCAEVATRHLKRLVPHTLSVFYSVDEGTGEIVAQRATGPNASFVEGLRIPLGQRLSGWVAANRQTILNSDPTLDFGGAANLQVLALKSCLSTPIVGDDELIGVLSIYSGELSAFTEDHRRIIELVAHELSIAAKRCDPVAHSVRSDALKRLRPFERLAEAVHESAKDSESSLVFVTVSAVGSAAAPIGSHAANDLLVATFEAINRHFKETDFLFFNGRDRFALWLPNTSVMVANAVVTAMKDALALHSTTATNGGTIKTEVTVSAISTPADSVAVMQLAATPDALLSSFGTEKEPRIH